MSTLPRSAMTTRPAFVPTSAHIAAAENLMVAMAFEQTIRPIVTGYQIAILVKHQFRIAQRWVKTGDGDSIITEPNLSYLLEETDFSTYHRECYEAGQVADLKVADPEHCPLLVAENIRRLAANELLKAISDLPGLESFGTAHSLSLEAHAKAVDLTLRLIGPFCTNGAALLNQIVQT